LLQGLIVVLVSLSDRGLTNFLTKMATLQKERPEEQNEIHSISSKLGAYAFTSTKNCR